MRFLTKKINESKSNTIISFIYEDSKQESEVFKHLNTLSNGELAKQIYEYKTIKGSVGEVYKYSINKDLKAIIVGLGKKEKLTRQIFSQCVAQAARSSKGTSKNKSLALDHIPFIKLGMLVAKFLIILGMLVTN